MRKFCSLALVFVFVVAFNAKAQYEPPPKIKKEFDAAIKKVGDYLKEAEEDTVYVADKFAASKKEADKVKKRWDDCKANATEAQKKNATKNLNAITNFGNSITSQLDSQTKGVSELKKQKTSVENDAKNATDFDEYFAATKAASALQATSSSVKKQADQTFFMWKEYDVVVENLFDIVVSVENNEQDEGQTSNEPETLIDTFSTTAATTSDTFTIITEAFEGDVVGLADAYSEVMEAWYMALYMDPESISEEEGKMLSQITNEIWAIQQYVDSSVETLYGMESMIESSIMMALEIEDPWEQMEAFALLASNSDNETYDSLSGIIAHAYERKAEALLILGVE